MASLLEQALVLSFEEKLKLIEALWDSMAQNPEDIQVPSWQRAELKRRIESQRANPKKGQTWDELKQAILDSKE